MELNDIIKANTYTASVETCPGCANHCQVKLFTFANGKVFASGNNCEKIYSSGHNALQRGRNMFEYKYRILFGSPTPHQDGRLRIGIPRALGIYENFPFWRTLLEQCGIEVVLSSTSTAKTYETGIRTIMADNICFPAKLMHGHILDLLENKHIDRLLYPFVVYEQKEDKSSKNSFNCPIVSAYADVIRSAVNPQDKYGIPLDSPVVNFSNEHLLRASCTDYLLTLGIDSSVAQPAITAAIAAQQTYLSALENECQTILHKAEKEGRMVIMLAGRPYHTDPFIEHKISHAIADMGIDVITEHIAIHNSDEVYNELHAVTQWAYPNRIFKAAHFVAHYPHPLLQMVELTSFGCGPDAFILDEVQSLLARYHKNLTLLKIDDVNNIGSLKLRVRSMVESLDINTSMTLPAKPFITTKTFEREDSRRTILAPYFAEGYSEFIEPLFTLAGYRLITLPMGSQADAETGLRFANNDVCYPATIVIGSIMNALQSGLYDLNKTAVLITQTGGQCRATNYFALIKNAMVEAGYANVPLLSLATSNDVNNSQPGFQISYQRLARILVHSMAYADALNRLYHSAAVRIKHQLLQQGQKGKDLAQKVRNKYIDLGKQVILRNRPSQLKQLIHQAADEFTEMIDKHKDVPVIGLVGEIYVKYNSFSHKNVVNWLLENEVEVIPPRICDFFSTSFVNQHANRLLHIRTTSTPAWITDGLYKWIRLIIKQYDKQCADYPFYRPSTDIFDIARLSKQVINTAADFGEGWMLPGEICHLAESGVKNIISLQPFGCIANHIISKGIEKKLRTIYPQVNMLFLDFDSSTGEANIYNRLHFLVDNARKVLN